MMAGPPPVPSVGLMTTLHEDRRAEPRFPLAAPVVLTARGGSVAGRTVDASSTGLLVELTEPLSFLAHEVGVELTTAGGEVIQLEADIVRRAISHDGAVMIALRLSRAPAGRALAREAGTTPRRVYGRRVRPSRAKPRAGRAPAVVREELKAVGTRVLELALADADARAPGAMTGWVASLAGELGRPAPSPQASARSLLRVIAELHRERPLQPAGGAPAEGHARSRG